MVTTTCHPKLAVYHWQGARRQNCRDNATAKNGFLGAMTRIGSMGNVVIITMANYRFAKRCAHD